MDSLERLVWVVVGLGLGEVARWVARRVMDAELRAEMDETVRRLESTRHRQAMLNRPYREPERRWRA